VSTLPAAPYHRSGGSMDTSSMNMRRRPAAPFLNSTAIHNMASFSTTSSPPTEEEQEQDDLKQGLAAIMDMDADQHARALAVIDDMDADQLGSDSIDNDYGNSANEMEWPSFSSLPLPSSMTSTADASESTAIVTTFDMRRAVYDILECLPNPGADELHASDRSSTRNTAGWTWKFQWQREERQQKRAAYAERNNKDDNSTNNKDNDNAIGMALALLRVLPEDAWKNFDALGLEDDDDEDDYDNNDDGVGEENELLVTREHPEQTSEYPDDAPALTRVDLDPELAAQALDSVEQDDDDDDEEQHGDGGDDIERLLDMLMDAKAGRVVLKTNDYNAILARLAIAPELTVEITLESVMQTYQLMVEMAKVGMADSGPDATTYELLMHTLHRRLSSSKTAVEIMREMMQSESVRWTPQTMKAAFQLCQGRNDLKTARMVLKDVIAEKSRSFKIPSEVLLVYLDMLKSEDAQKEALELLQLSMEVSTACAGRCFSFGFVFADDCKYSYSGTIQRSKSRS
jgi:hypothetical protein